MKKTVLLSMIAASFSLSLAAEDIQRDREPSVRKAIGSVPSITKKEGTQKSSQKKENIKTDTPRERNFSVRKAIGTVGAQEKKELDVVDAFVHMFQDGVVSGQIRLLTSGIDYKSKQSVYASAIGGSLKYELAEYKGFGAGVAFITSQSIDPLSGDGVKYNEELSSAEKAYTELSEAYIHYRYEDLELRAGRQVVDTPLADSDDIRMIPNTFEAYAARYKNDDLTLLGGYLASWQGDDEGLDNPWQKTGKDGTYVAGLLYEGDIVETNFWYYNINGEAGDETANNSYYVDVMGKYAFNKDVTLHAALQYLKQDELDQSGVESSIYGVSSELVFYGIGLNLAYNGASKKSSKQSFSGFGGGALYTNMDSMILDVITKDRKAAAVVAGLSYEYEDFNFLYAYGDFSGDADSSGQKEHIVEQNIGFSYEHEDLTVGMIYVQNDDKEQTDSNDGDWYNLRAIAVYNF